LLEVFWSTHDPTTLNRQGNDVGTQYRSVIFYHDDEQKELAEYFLLKLEESQHHLMIRLSRLLNLYRNFYIAEDYHQNYFNLNPQLPYCRFVIEPKLEKFRKVFADKLKK
jgi:peptide-methionine (S)-S-oxide reductase